MSLKMIDITECCNLLCKHPSFAYNILCKYYPLKQCQLIEHRERLNWWAVSVNKNINWDDISWRLVAHKLNHCAEGKEWQCDDNCVECSSNPTFPWCEELIEHWQQQVNWCYLAQNPTFLKNHHQLIIKYSQHFELHKQLIVDILVNNAQGYFDRQRAFAAQKERAESLIKFISAGDFTEVELITNHEILWEYWLKNILNDEQVDYLLPVIVKHMQPVWLAPMN